MVELAAGELPRHSITGREVSRVTSHTQAAQVELVRRRPHGHVRWRFRQSRPVLIWSRCAIEEQVLQAEGAATVTRPRNLGSRLWIVPANATFAGDIRVSHDFDYTMVFLNSTDLASTRWSCLDHFFEGNVCPEITTCLTSLTGEAASPDNLFDLLAESWIVQTLAFLTRTSSPPPPAGHRGGLTMPDRRRIEDYIRANLAAPIRMSSLARQVGLGERHFSRVFSQVFGEPPVSYIIRLRIEKAKHLLTTTRLPLTEIALEAGFCHAQHFSTKFHTSTGLSPSQFRHAART